MDPDGEITAARKAERLAAGRDMYRDDAILGVCDQTIYGDQWPHPYDPAFCRNWRLYA